MYQPNPKTEELKEQLAVLRTFKGAVTLEQLRNDPILEMLMFEAHNEIWAPVRKEVTKQAAQRTIDKIKRRLNGGKA